MKHPTGSLLACFFVFAILVMGCRGCPPKPDGPPNRNDNSSLPNPSPSPTVSKMLSDSTIKRVMANVMTGVGDPLPSLSDDDWHDLVARTQVRTDDNGEARLKLSGCMSVYLFQTSKMTYAACSKSENTGGNSYCQTAGTAVYNSSCAGRIEQVIQTPTADIIPKGTWITVTYLPDQQLTITLVLKGSAQVCPVIDLENRKPGEPIILNEGQYSLTMPDLQASQQGYEPSKLRQPKNLSDMPSELNKYLRPWLDRIKKHAEEDKIERKAYAFTADIDCDCEHLESGLLTKQFRLQCIRAEAEAWRQFYETGELGKCDPVAQGPNPRPKPTPAAQPIKGGRFGRP